MDRGNMLSNIRQRNQYINNQTFSGLKLNHAYIVFHIFFWKKYIRILGQKKSYDMETDEPKPLERSIPKLIITGFRCPPK